ncbi:hypothetical protein [Haloferula sp. BvORR071]|uniref:hypothetical protein n=1 Tax=Haloferula sp. BvORR071 TaxID=1396141 RepID=UPI000555D771|nr:hypothetical protein [Haloferula sp. BvORR071]
MSLSHALTNNLEATRLISLMKLRVAEEINPRDQHGPYILLQTGHAPGDLSMKAADYLLGRSGEWIALHWFLRMPVQQRREEFVFGTMTEVVTLMEDLCGDVKVIDELDDLDDDSPVDEEWHSAIMGP